MTDELQVLIRDLDDSRVEVRMKAVSALCAKGRGAAPAVAALKRRGQDENYAIRAHAAQSLWRIEQSAEPAVPMLIDVLRHGRMDDQRLAAFYLGEIGPSAVAAEGLLRQHLKHDSVPLRLHAAEALSKISPQDESGIGVVVQVLRTETEASENRRLAAMVLRSLDGSHRERVIREMSQLVNDANPRVRAIAVSTLDEIGSAPPIVQAAAVASSSGLSKKSVGIPVDTAASRTSVEPERLEPTPAAASEKTIAATSPKRRAVAKPAPVRTFQVLAFAASEEDEPQPALPPETEGPSKSPPSPGSYAPPESAASVDGTAEAPAGIDGDVKPIGGLTLRNRPSAGDLPVNYAATEFPRKGILVPANETARTWTFSEYNWVASADSNGALYFQDVNLERYGNVLWPIQPIVSGGRFFVTTGAMPVLVLARLPFLDETYSLGYFRPGDDVPSTWHYEPPTICRPRIPRELRGTPE